jgi:hypothetical protein
MPDTTAQLLKVVKTLKALGNAQVRPSEDSADSGQGIAAVNSNIDEYQKANPPAGQPSIATAVTAPAPMDKIRQGYYGSVARRLGQPAEARIDTSSMTKPLGQIPSYDSGTDSVPDDQLALVHQGEKIVPADQNPDNPNFVMQSSQNPYSGLPQIMLPSDSTQLCPLPTGENDDMREKLTDVQDRAHEQGDLVTAGKAAIAHNQLDKHEDRNAPTDLATLRTPSAMPKSAPNPYLGSALAPAPDALTISPSGTPEPSVSPLGSVMPRYSGTARIGGGTPGEAELHNELEQRRADLKNQIANAPDAVTRDKAQVALDGLNNGHPWGSAANHPGFAGKLGHVLGTIGNIAGDVLAPGVMANIPGTELNRRLNAGADVARLSADEKAQSENAARAATTAHTTQETKDAQGNRPLQNALAVQGWNVGKDEKGQTTVTRMPGWEAAPKTLQDHYANAVQNALSRGVDPAKDSSVQSYANAIKAIEKPEKADDFDTFYTRWLKDHPNARDNSHSETLARKEWSASGQQPPQTLLMVPGPNNTLTGVVARPGTTIADTAAKPGEAATATERTITAHDKAYVQPADAVEKSYEMMDNAYREYKDARAKGQELPTGAQSMVALSTHLSTTFGNVKGARITKDMIQEHLGARGISDRALVAMQRFTNGDVLSPDQWDAFHDLIKQSRQLSWDTATREADRKHVPINFLPDDYTAVKVPGHNASIIPTNSVGAFQKKYPNGQVLSGGQ